jgi:hypothetical protein
VGVSSSDAHRHSSLYVRWRITEQPLKATGVK